MATDALAPTTAEAMTPGLAPALALDTTAHPIVLFDGVCNFCNASVSFLLERDPAGALRFAPLQSPLARALVARHGGALPEGDPEGLVVIDGGRLYERTDAALRLALRLRGAWKLLYALIVVPRVVRDAAYRFFARRRYRWFGRADACRVPTPEVRARFLA